LPAAPQTVCWQGGPHIPITRRYTMRLHGTLGILAALLLVAADTAKDDGAKKEMDKLQGTWKLVSGEFSGKPLAGGDLEGAEFTIKGDKYTFKQGDTTEEGTIKVDPAKKPPTIDLKIASGNDKDKTQLGIYKLEGDKFTVCFAKAGATERPTMMSTKEDSDQLLFGFKKEKADK